MELPFFISLYHLVMLSICAKFLETSQRGSELLSGYISLLKFSKGHNSVKNVGGVMVLVLCKSSDGALYLYQVW